jgi:hypothetical protein
MCPVCLASTAVIVATGATSAGGLAALVAKVMRVRSRPPTAPEAEQAATAALDRGAPAPEATTHIGPSTIERKPTT